MIALVYPYERANVEAVFPYHTPETDKLRDDLEKIFTEPVPYWALKNDILLTLFDKKTDYFMIPKTSSTKNKDTYFRFDVKVENGKNEYGKGPATFVYWYKGYDFNEHS